MHTGKKSSGDTEREESVPQSYSIRKNAESSWERHHLSAGNVETVLALAPTLLDTREHTLERKKPYRCSGPRSLSVRAQP